MIRLYLVIFCVIYTVSGTCKVAYKFSIVVETEVCKESKKFISMTILQVGLCRFIGLKLTNLSLIILLLELSLLSMDKFENCKNMMLAVCYGSSGLSQTVA